MDTTFFYYLLKSKVEFIKSLGTGTTFAEVSATKLKGIEFDFPKLKDQKAIAKILSSLDDKIELNRKMNATLEEMARAVFKAWFVDFEPVHANANNQPSTSASPEIAKLFPAEFQESELGLIPKGWEATNFGKVYEIFDRKRIPLSGKERDKRKGEFPYYGAASIMDYIDDYIFDGVFLLIGEDGSVIKTDGTPVIQYAWGKFWVNNHAHVLQGKDKISTEHLMLSIQNVNVTPYITGAVQLKINQGNLSRIPFIKPIDEISTVFHNSIKQFYSKIRHNIEENKNLEEIRDSLLPRLISGKIAVGEIEKEVADAM